MPERSTTDQAVRRALIKAYRQYDAAASDYLAGVISGLSGSPGLIAGPALPVPLPPDRAELRGSQRTREFYRGRIAALEWATGITTIAPV